MNGVEAIMTTMVYVVEYRRRSFPNYLEKKYYQVYIPEILDKARSCGEKVRAYKIYDRIAVLKAKKEFRKNWMPYDKDIYIVGARRVEL